MTRPTVLIASVDADVGRVLRSVAEGICSQHGLRLKVGSDKSATFESKDDLFDYLESREPGALCDCLVLLYVDGLEEAFSASVSGHGQGWHRTHRGQAGIAVELLLRFPQVFPVFVSPDVPCAGSSGGEKGRTELAKPATNVFAGTVLERFATASFQEVEISADSLFGLAAPLHFVSIARISADLQAVCTRFAHGMRCWFDPTGLRTLVKHRFLGTVFGNKSNWDNTETARKILRRRLPHVAVAVDEEREFAMLNAYAAWKFGRRAWLVTSYAEFHEHPLWATGATPSDGATVDVVVLRDIDLRFPDVPENDTTKKFRAESKDINGRFWKEKIGDDWTIRAISGEHAVYMEGSAEERKYFGFRDGRASDKQPTARRLGQRKEEVDGAERLIYLGLAKPVASLYELARFLGDKAAPVEESLIAGLRMDRDDACQWIDENHEQGQRSRSNHGAPYVNLAMAESLLLQARRQGTTPSECIVSALLASEAYELLLGMSKTTALEALVEMHRAEVCAEVGFPGIADSMNISLRAEDVEATIGCLYEGGDAARSKRARRLFLMQFWADLRLIYRNAERFNAAEEANIRSLVQSEWFRWFKIWPRGAANWFRKRFSWVPRGFRKPVTCEFWKDKLVRTAIYFRWWVLNSALVYLLLTAMYAWAADWSLDVSSLAGWERFFDLFGIVILNSFAMDVTPKLKPFVDAAGPMLGPVLVIVHFGIAYVLFAVLVAMLYRKVTRS